MRNQKLNVFPLCQVQVIKRVSGQLWSLQHQVSHAKPFQKCVLVLPSTLPVQTGATFFWLIGAPGSHSIRMIVSFQLHAVGTTVALALVAK